jgi:hypothetical protein
MVLKQDCLKISFGAWGGGGEGIMGDLIIRMQQNVGTYWILSIGELHSSIVFCIVEYANPFMSKYATFIL